MIFNNKYPISVVWVDLDDTIIDFTTNARSALVRLYDTEHLNRWWSAPELWAEAYESHNHALWARYNIGEVSREYLRMERFALPLTDAGVARAEAEQMSRKFDGLYLDYLAQEKNLMPGAMELLQHLRRCGAKIGIISNGFKEVQYRKMDSDGVTPWIDVTVLSDDIGVNKPDKRIFRHAMYCTGENNPSRHLLIGDNPDTDIAGALNAGWHAVHYLPARAMCGGVLPAQGCTVRKVLLEIAAMITP